MAECELSILAGKELFHKRRKKIPSGEGPKVLPAEAGGRNGLWKERVSVLGSKSITSLPRSLPRWHDTIAHGEP